MATKIDIPPLPQFDPHSHQSSLSQWWKSWMKRFETYLVPANITDDKQKRAMLLYQVGSAAQDIFEILSDTGSDYATSKKKLDDYFSPKKNVDYEVFQFQQAKQLSGESVKQFATRIRKIAVNCEFHDMDQESRWRLYITAVQSAWHNGLLEKMLTHSANCWLKPRRLEKSRTYATGMEEKLPSERDTQCPLSKTWFTPSTVSLCFQSYIFEQLLLAPESWYITTFATHKGLLEVHSTQFWQQLCQWEISKDHSRTAPKFSWHQWWHCLWQDKGWSWCSTWRSMPDIHSCLPHPQQEVWI